MAVAIAVMFAINEKYQNAQLAEKAPKEIATATLPPSRPLPPSSMSAAPAPTEKAAEMKRKLADESGKREGAEKMKERLAIEEKPSAVATSAPSAEAPRGPASAQEVAAAEKPSGATLDALEKPEGRPGASQPAALKPAPNAAPPAFRGDMAKGEGYADKLGEESGGVVLANEPAAPSTPPAPAMVAKKDTSSPAKDAYHAGKAGGDQGGLQYSSKASGGRDRNAKQAAPAADGVLVVHCDISTEAAHRGAFDKLLDANGIAWQESDARNASRLADAEKSNAASPRKPTIRAKDGKAAGKKSAAETTDEQIAAQDDRSAQTKDQVVREAKPSGGALDSVVDQPADMKRAAGGPLDLVYVEATSAQIEATLAGLAAQPDAFLSVSVEPAPGEAEQQFFSQYNRRAAGDRKADQSRAVGQQSKTGPRPAAKAADTDVAANKAEQADEGQATRGGGQGFAQRIQVPAGAMAQDRMLREQAAQVQMKSPASGIPLGSGMGGMAQQAAPGAAPAEAQSETPRQEAEATGGTQEAAQARLQPQMQQSLARTPTTQRVLFVLRVVGQEAAAARIHAAEADANRAPDDPAAAPAQR